MSHYVHHIPGRLRIKNPMFKKNPTLLEEARLCFEGADGITGISTNELTGSMVVTYDKEIVSSDHLFNVFRECEYVDENKAVTLDSKMKESFTQAGRLMGKACLSMVVDRALQGSGLSFLAALI